jgi:hypothetical protein
MRALLTLLLLCASLSPGLAQYLLEGKVLDATNNQPLPFVNILINDQKSGAITDIDGRFRISQAEPIRQLRLSYVGYENHTQIIAAGTTKINIQLQRKTAVLQEVAVVAGENPAHRVIREAVRQRDENNPEKLANFRYTAYNRFVVTIDSADRPMNDSIRVIQMKDSTRYDSSNYELANFFRKRDLFLTESLSERDFVAPDLSHEKVLAIRTSGIKNPMFVMLSSQLQSFSFYPDYISILDVRYLNPISPGSTSRYFFHLEDTLYDGPDSIYVISFKPLKGSNIQGMKGLLYIHTGGYAIQNVLAEPADSLPGLNIRIRQQYKRIDGRKWFPAQLNTDIYFTELDLGPNLWPVAIARSYLTDIQLNPGLRKRDLTLNGTEILRDATNKPIGFWEPYRPDSLSERDLETYRFIDSISTQFKLEQRLRWALALSTGRLPVGPIDIRLRDILGGNRYEGLRLGMSLATNDKVSPWFSLGGYAAWGFRDKQGKYGLNTDFYFDKRKRYTLSLYGHNDLIVNGGYQLFNNETALINNHPDRLVYFFNQFFDRERALGAKFRFLNVRYLSGDIGFKSSFREQTPWFHYRYLPLVPGYDWGAPLPEAVNAPTFQFSELGVQLRYAFREKTLRLLDKEYTIENRYPMVYASYQRGLKLWGGQWDFHRLVGRIEKSFVIRHAGVLSAVVAGGAVWGSNSLPIQQLFYMRGVGRNTGVFVPFSFQTFDMHEFAGNQFAEVHLRHNFESLLFRTEKQQPVFAIHHNSGWSRLTSPGDHYFTDQANFYARVADARLGYHESGFSVSNIRLLDNRWGVGFFYRYGAYTAPRWQDNWAVKLVLVP